MDEAKTRLILDFGFWIGTFSMKSFGKIMAIIFALVLFLNSCGTNQQNVPNGSKGKTLSVKGKVVEIQRGKDGYTAKIESSDGKTYSATISSIALENKYREVKIG